MKESVGISYQLWNRWQLAEEYIPELFTPHHLTQKSKYNVIKKVGKGSIFHIALTRKSYCYALTAPEWIFCFRQTDDLFPWPQIPVEPATPMIWTSSVRHRKGCENYILGLLWAGSRRHGPWEQKVLWSGVFDFLSKAPCNSLTIASVYDNQGNQL